MDAIRKIEWALLAGPTEGEWYHERIDPKNKNWEMSEVWSRGGFGSKAVATAVILERDAAYIAATQPAAIREVLRTIASKEAELVRMREALAEVQRVLVRENGRENGAIVDTIWRSPHETLFDYIESAITQPTE
jgi:hypothetical protein